MASVLVFGAGGYIGIPLCEELSRRGHDVIAADRWFFGRKPKVPCVTADIRTVSATHKHISAITITNGGPLAGAVAETTLSVHPQWIDFSSLDAVIDLAGLSNDASAEIDPDLTRSINLEGGKRLATMAKQAGIKRYIYSSSCSVYGHGGPDLTESSDMRPLTAYASSKAMVEGHIRSLEGDGFSAVILRNATVFGLAPRMRFDLVANIMAMTAWRDHQIMVRGGEQWRPFVHVDNVVDAFCLALTGDPGTYNVGTENLTINQLARRVSEAAPWAKIVRVSEAVDLRDYHVSFDKFREWRDKIGGYRRIIGPVEGAQSIIAALRNEEISADDPTTSTLRWYTSLIEWDRRLADLRLDGRIL